MSMGSTVTMADRGVVADEGAAVDALRRMFTFYVRARGGWPTQAARDVEIARAVIGDVLYSSFPSVDVRTVQAVAEQRGVSVVLRLLADAIDSLEAQPELRERLGLNQTL